METHRVFLKTSFDILNSFITAVVLLFLLDPTVFFGAFSAQWASGSVWVLLRILALGGVCLVLANLLPGKSVFGTRKGFWKNVLALVAAIVLLFLLDPTVFFGAFSAQWAMGLLWMLLRILALSGVYGVLADLSSGESVLVSGQGFWKNALAFWPFILLIQVLMFGAQFLVFFVNPDWDYDLFNRFLDPLWVLLIAIGCLKHKYREEPLRIFTVRLSWQTAGVFLALAVLKICVEAWLQTAVPGNGLWLRFGRMFPVYGQLFIYLLFLQVLLDANPHIKRRQESARELYLILPMGNSIYDFLISLVVRVIPPVFVVLTALTPREYRIRHFNRVLWRRRYARAGKLVAISCSTRNCCEIYKIAKAFREQGSKVVLGGAHVSFASEEALEFCDSVVVGEAEGVWEEVLRDYESGQLKRIYAGEKTERQQQLVQAELLRSSSETIFNYLETTRGCKFDCDFCCVPALSKRQIYHKAIPDIIELIKKIRHRYRYFSFLDDNIFADPAYAQEFFEALIPLKIHWNACCSVDIGANEKVLSLAKQSGCRMLIVGYEIPGGSPERQKGGKLAMADRYLAYSRKIKGAGILIKANFIFGFDGDRLRDYFHYWWFCLRIFPFFATIHLLVPYPGARIFDQALRENRILNLNWSDYHGHHGVLQPSRISASSVKMAYLLAYLAFIFTASSGGWLLMFLALVYALRQ